MADEPTLLAAWPNFALPVTGQEGKDGSDLPRPMADWLSARAICALAVRLERIFASAAGPAEERRCRQEIPGTG
jgi:hypothetical protein